MTTSHEPTTDDEAAQAATRQCGRCRALFPKDPTLHEFGPAEWWLCEPCREVLIAGGGRSMNTAGES